MAYLIDGYNLLHVTTLVALPGPGTELHRARQALLKFLAGAFDKTKRQQITIVFDAAGAPPGLPAMLQHEGITVRFARQYTDADEMIEELLESWPAPRALTVVSSDHRVQRAARSHGAKWVDSATWYAEVNASLRKESAAPDAPAKPLDGITAEQEAAWLREFSEGVPGQEQRQARAKREKNP